MTRNPENNKRYWIPAFAGMTPFKRILEKAKDFLIYER
jgi:hypothetical protein